jgi:hypothetical protein
LALRDLQRLGYTTKQIETHQIPAFARRLVELLKEFVNSQERIECLGYAFVFEFNAMTRELENIEQWLNWYGINSPLSCFKAHSRSGVEPKHVNDICNLVGSLSISQRVACIQAAFRTAQIYFSSLDVQPDQLSSNDANKTC